MKLRTFRLLAAATIFVGMAITAFPSTFVYTYQTVFDNNADQYVVGQDNVKKYSEWENPPATYWGPSANDVQGILTMRFDFAAATSQIFLDAEITSANWANAGRSDFGYSSLWASTDGSSWQLLLNNQVVPGSNIVGTNMVFSQNLSSPLLGQTSIWLQVRMQEHNALVNGNPPSTSWADAQFSRYDPANPPMSGPTFEMDVTTVPEPAGVQFGFVAVLVLVTVAGKRMGRARKHQLGAVVKASQFVFTIVTSVFVSQCVQAADPVYEPIPGLFSTGVDASGEPLPVGGVDSHWRIESSPRGSTSARVTDPFFMWTGDTSSSAWINGSGSSSDYPPPGLYIYTTTFSLSGFDPSTARISGGWASDNLSTIYLNGVSTPFVNTPPWEFTSFESFTLTSGFVAGENTLSFVLTQDPDVGGNPAGLQVDISSAVAVVPEAGPLAYYGIGVLVWTAIYCLRRKTTA